jgi:hypothetical protein
MVGVILFLVLFASTVFLGFIATPIFGQGIRFIEQVATPGPSITFGVSVSVMGAIVVFLYTAVTQNIKTKNVLRSYRAAEQKLIDMGKMESREIVEYHRSYNWHSYAGLGFSTLFIIIALFLEGRLGERAGTELAVITLGLALISAATVILGVVDLVHTNTLTPLVTVDRRFAIINVIIVLGGFALSLQICAVGVFLSLINSWLSVFTTGVMLILMITLTQMRGIPVKSLHTERSLTLDEIKRIVRDH